MRLRSRVALGLVATAAVVVSVAGQATGTVAVAQSKVVGAVPPNTFPWINDGAVHAIAQVGNTMVVGGTFSTVSTPGGATTVSRTDIVAFDATTGAISSFAPTLDGEVDALTPGLDGHSVYVGGQFTFVNGVRSKSLALLDLNTGSAVSGFSVPFLDGLVERLQVSGGRLFMGGTFSTVNAIAHAGFATLDATTGAVDPYMNVQVSGHHNYTGLAGQAEAGVGVTSFDISPDGTQMVAIGNFKQVNGITHDQIVRINLNTDAAVVDDSWNTTVFTTACSSSAFDSWVRDVSYSPDGSYFVVVGTGGPHPGQYCDAAIRFETPSTGTTVAPTWADWTGGDSLWSVAVTGTAVYVGGHQRWLNNPNGTDSAQAGAVPRPGLGALDPITGIPLSWNPGRNPRGAGAWAVLATPAGLWVGSDTEWIGNFLYHRKRIAFFPLSSGLPTALGNPGALPNDIFKLGQYSGGTYTNGLSSINFNGTTAGDPFTPASTGITWGSARAAVQIDGKVLFGWSDGTLHVRSFDGTGWGPDQIVDPYNDPYWSSVATGSGQTYKGVRPAFYSLIPNLTSMFYWNNRLYYTRSGNNGLWYRMFNPDSYIMGAQEFTAGSLGVRRVGIAGAFVGGGNVYWANPSDGTLHAMSFTSGVPSGTDQVVSGPSIDGFDWRARGLFISPQAPHGPNQPPTARIIANCSHSTCGFDGTTSSDPESGPLTYSWNLGDGTTSTSPSLTHDYATPGTYTVTLTVTDNRGQTGTATQPVTTTAAAPITFLGASHFDKAATLGSVTVPAGVQAGDALLMFVSVNNGTSAVTPPGGWQLVGTENTPTTSPVLVTQVYSRVAGASDAGQPVNVTLSATAKLDMQLLAYHNTDPTTPVQTSAFRADTASTATHVTPAVTVSGAGALPVSYWVDKSSTTTSWTTPAGLTLRDTALDTGAGYLTSVVADPNVAVAPGTYAGQTATTDVAGSKANMWTVVLNPTP